MNFPILAFALTAGAAPGDPTLPYEKYTLPNGIEVLLHPDNRVPIVAVSVWYHVGSGDETPGRSGFAHLFEHMMFQGSVNTGQDVHFDVLRQIGATTVNGTTNPDRTNYFEVVPAQHLETALWLESDRMGYMLPLLTDESFANQRDVVRNERRQRVENVPYGREYLAVNEALYPEGHPYRYTTIGRSEDLEAAQTEDVRAFFRKWYVPANATVAIGGAFEPAEAKRLVEKWFGTFPASAKPAHTAAAPVPVAGPVRVEVQDPFAKLRRVRWAWHTPAVLQPGDADLDLLATALAEEGTGRLYQRLVHEEQLAQSVSAVQQSMGLSSSFHVTVDVRGDADLARVEQILEEEIAKVREQPLDARDLSRAVAGYESGFVWSLEGLLGRVETLQRYNDRRGEPDSVGWDLDRYRAATPESVRATAAQYLTKESRVEVITTGGGAK